MFLSRRKMVLCGAWAGSDLARRRARELWSYGAAGTELLGASGTPSPSQAAVTMPSGRGSARPPWWGGGGPRGLADVRAGDGVRGQAGATHSEHERIGSGQADLLDRRRGRADAEHAIISDPQTKVTWRAAAYSSAELAVATRSPTRRTTTCTCATTRHWPAAGRSPPA